MIVETKRIEDGVPETVISDRCLIHRHRREDADEIFYAYASKPEATRFVVWPVHHSVDETRAYLRYAIAAWKAGTTFAFTVRLKYPQRLIGSIGLVPDGEYWQVGYILSPSMWGRGLATEMLQAVLQMPVIQATGKLKSFVNPDNTASIRVLEKAGFIHYGEVRDGIVFPNVGPERRPCLEFRLSPSRIG